MTFEIIHNAETGEITEKPYSKEQLASDAAAKIEIEARLEEERALATAKANLLAKLGITEDEAKLLLA